MEFQFSTGTNGTQGVRTQQGYTERASTSSPVRLTGYILRGVAVVLTFIAAIVMGTTKETVVITNGEVSAIVTFKSTDSSSYVYFIVINVLAFLYSLVLLVISIVKRANSGNLALPFTVADLLMGVLLFSCNSAASAETIGSEGRKGVIASIVLSMFASVAYLLLILLTIVGLHRSK